MIVVDQIKTALGGGKKTVASVLSGFQKVLDDLDSVRTASLAEVERQELIINDAEVTRLAAIGEAEAATKAAKKIGALIGDF